MSHLKRQRMPKNWPVARKGNAYIVKPSFNLEKGIPVLIVLRDMLKIVENRKELKKAIHRKSILLNGNILRDEKSSATLFDTITLVPSKKNYRIELTENGKFKISEIKETESTKKIAKVVGKKILKGKKVQLNFNDGKNLISEIKCNIDDSVLINLKDKKIEKCVELKEKANAIIFAGKHAGEAGVIEKIDRDNKMAIVNSGDEKSNILIKQLMVTQ
jgi:small subunit ribosomal protein S4e